MKDVARMILRHFDGIVAWAQMRQTNGFIEAINGLFQAAKRKATINALRKTEHAASNTILVDARKPVMNERGKKDYGTALR